jgi:hypothetical protein
MRLRHLTAAVVSASVALLFSPAVPAAAHETGAIHVSSHQVAIGGTVDVRGEKLPKSSALNLELRGVLDNFPVGIVHTDTAGAFQMALTVPKEVPAGPYTLVVTASDGDVTARADLVVGGTTTASASPAGTKDTGMAGMPGMGGNSEERANPAAMPIAHTTTAGEWVVIWALILACVGAGAALLAKSKATALQHGIGD